MSGDLSPDAANFPDIVKNARTSEDWEAIMISKDPETTSMMRVMARDMMSMAADRANQSSRNSNTFLTHLSGI
jgi:hypothetical protein